MFKAIKESKLFYCALSVMIAAGFVAGFGGKTYAAGKTAEVSSADELTAALADEDVDHIVITQSFDVPCATATIGNTSYFTVDRNMIIEGSDPSVTLKRTKAEGASNGSLQSIIGFCGDGKYDGVQVSLFNLTLDGGADFGDRQGNDKRGTPTSDKCLGGRSVLDVYYKATLNLEDGLTIKNGYCTYSLTSLASDSSSNKYGGGVRVDHDTETGGGTVNVKAGSSIINCVSLGYGGGIGAYSYSRLNVYGGLIEDCDAQYGGAVGCTWRASHNATVSGTFRMYGGTIKNCSADMGGALLADGDPNYCFNALYGGTIIDCTASSAGSALRLRGGAYDGVPSISIAPYSENGPLQIINCPALPGDVDPSSEFGDISFGYTGIDLAGQQNNVLTLESAVYSVSFKKFKDDDKYLAVLTVKKDMPLGESFPGDPTGDSPFIEWNTAPDGSGMTVTKDIPIKTNMVVYARWLSYVEGTTSEDLTITYGDKDKYIEIIDAYIPYGGEILYQWCEVVDVPEYEWPFVDIEGETSSRYNLPILNVGTHRFACQLSNHIPPQTLGHASDTITVTVNPRVLNLSWSDLSFVCDGKAKIPTATLDGIVEGDDVSVEVTGAQTKAGTYKANAVLTGKDAANYVIASGKDSVEFVIKPAPTATPTAKPQVPAEVKMPDLKGMNYKDAQTKLEKFLKDNGINATVSIGWGHNSDPKKNLTVASTTPNAGEKIAADTKTIIIMVYEGYNPPANALTLDKTKLSVVVGKTAQLKATLTGYSSAVTWKSSDTKIATVDKNGKITTKMAGTVTITASVSNLTSASCEVTVLYKDVTNTKDFWYAPTNYLSGKGVVKGYDKQTLFKPANMCTRAQMVTFIWRLQGEPAPKAKTCKFKDVKKTDYFYKACIWGNENHIVEGYKNGTFGPQIVCARKHAVTFLWRLANKPNPSSKTNKFKDVKKSDYFYQATLWASEKGILAGYSDGTFRPDGDCLRRQMVTFLYKYDKFVNNKG